ncbi:conjugal transfer protein TraG N-terminal domain-containing protein [Azospirillum sp. BE72]|uniref:conjugal transfer protein TraG N-terminal domain-containing protein n=1 Tax=Azospirillum sp. BE72 TaxID=2817776 RepID=UPI00285B3C2E|nr:conjugal transfer protein TraG N-terminal domain-containing protein [Azospirillum sp. BE72]MDR6775705.1 hypothetical protein [Azospirillum sp. BE72]
MWNINSIGDSAFLAEILNAVAMIVGTGEFYAVAQIGLLLGALLVCFQAVAAGARAIDWQKVFLGWVVFSLLFGPSTTVVVTDAYTGQVRPVANVPVGVAAGGSLISEIGYQLTVLFEQGFSMPAMTQHGYGSSLEVLKKVRVHSGDPLMLGPANRFAGGSSNFERSWTDYIQRCTMTGLSSGVIDPHTIYNSAELVSALKFDSRIWMAELWLGSSGSQNYDCTEAHARLASITPVVVQDYLGKVLPSVLNVPASDVPAKIGDALLALGVTAVTPTQFVTTSILQPIFERAAVARSEEDRAFSYAKMIEDAKNQRAMSWIGEASMFRSIVRPMLTFLEGFTYAVTPIMGFLVVLGPLGISIAGKYVLTLLWIQLWMPVLAIVNLFIHMSLTGRLGGLEDSGFSLGSMNGLLAADGALQKWISTGEMLASSVPALTLMLIYGGSVAATHLAGRLQGGDFIKEDKVARDTFNATPKYQMAPSYTGDSSRVTMASGADQMLTSFNVGSLAQSAESSTKSVADAKTHTFASNLASTVGTQAVQQYQTGHSELFKSGSAFQGSKTYELVSSSMKDVTDRFSRGDDVKTQLINSAALEYGLTGNISPGLRLKLGEAFGGAVKGGVEAGVSVGAGGKVTDQMSGAAGHSAAAQIEASIRAQFGRNDKLSGALTDTAMREAADTSQNSFTSSLSESHQKTLSESAQQALTAQEAYQRADSLARSFGTSQTISAGQAVNSINQQHGGRERLEAELERRNLKGARDALIRMDERSGGAITKAFANREDAITYAGLMTLNNQNKMQGASASSSAEVADRKAALLGLLSGATNHNSDPMGDPSRNAHLEESAAGIPQPRAEVQSVVGRKPIPAFGQVKAAGEPKMPDRQDLEGSTGRKPLPQSEDQGRDGSKPIPAVGHTNGANQPNMPTRADLEKRFEETEVRHRKEFNDDPFVQGTGELHDKTRSRVREDMAPGQARFNNPSLVRSSYETFQHDPGHMVGINVEPKATQGSPSTSSPEAPSNAPPLMQGNGHPSTGDVEAAPPPKQPSTGVAGSRPPGTLAQGRAN